MQNKLYTIIYSLRDCFNICDYSDSVVLNVTEKVKLFIYVKYPFEDPENRLRYQLDLKLKRAAHFFVPVNSYSVKFINALTANIHLSGKSK